MEPEREWQIKRVTAVQTPYSKKDWFPMCKEYDDVTFFRFAKFERGVIFALTGKGLELRATKSPHLLDGKEYDRIVHLRNAECNRRYQETMKKAAEALGEEWKPTKTSMMAKDDHRLIVAQYVTITLPVLQKDAACIGPLEAKGLFERIKRRGLKNIVHGSMDSFQYIVDSSNKHWNNIFFKPCPENSCYMRILYFDFPGKMPMGHQAG